MIPEKTIAAQITAVNVQLIKFLFLIEITVDFNNMKIPMSAGIKIQRIDSLVTYNSFGWINAANSNIYANIP